MRGYELHLFILWKNARNKQQIILDHIQDRFTILRIYEVAWTPDKVSSNYTRFYGQYLPTNSEKEKECGIGPFLLVVVIDKSPIYEMRVTSHGSEIVNINTFDCKLLYRSWTGGGHKIHATNSVIEANHDLTLLLGINIKDFLTNNNTKWDGTIIKKEQDIVGINGWNNLKELFYVLNNTVSYVILRGADSFIDISNTSEHLDVDFLVETAKDFQLILNGELVYSEYRPHVLVLIGGIKYYFDLWETSRDYFDSQWQREMINTKVQKGYLYVLNEKNYFYALLYHCLINKGIISSDYEQYLLRYRDNNNLGNLSWDELLVQFIKAEHYDITLPKDKSIVIKKEGQINDFIAKNGILIKSLIVSVDNSNYYSKVYEKEESFIKSGSPLLINAEYLFLSRLKGSNLFPKVIKYDKDKSIEISRVHGQSIKDSLLNNKDTNPKLIRSFIKKCIDILSILYENNVVHRDLTPDNLFVSLINKDSCEVFLIDFGWAVNTDELSTAIRPKWLGHTYAPLNDSSDFYSLGSLLMEFWPNIPFVYRIANKLHTVHSNHYTNVQDIKNIICYVRQEVNHTYYLKDFRYYLHNWLKITYHKLIVYVPFVYKLRLFLYNYSRKDE